MFGLPASNRANHFGTYGGQHGKLHFPREQKPSSAYAAVSITVNSQIFQFSSRLTCYFLITPQLFPQHVTIIYAAQA